MGILIISEKDPVSVKENLGWNSKTGVLRWGQGHWDLEWGQWEGKWVEYWASVVEAGSWRLERGGEVCGREWETTQSAPRTAEQVEV